MPQLNDTDVSAILAHEKEYWRLNPDDPTIYISFSLLQFAKSYAQIPQVKNLLAKEKLGQIPPDVVEKYQESILKEWGERAGLPIKLLPESVQLPELAKKNVYFILGRSGPHRVLDGVTVNFNLLRQYNLQFKLSLLPIVPLDKLTNQEIYTVLHEFGHAVEQKHQVKYIESDLPPFNEKLDCQDTIMAYTQHCKPVQNTKHKFFGKQPLNYLDPDPSKQENIKAVRNSYPTTLGELDIAAAKKIRERWGIKSQNNNATKPDGYHEELFTVTEFNEDNPSQEELALPNYLNENYLQTICSEPLDYFAQKIAGYAKKIVANCPSYFPKTTPSGSYWGNKPGLLFSATSNNNHVDALPIMSIPNITAS